MKKPIFCKECVFSIDGKGLPHERCTLRQAIYDNTLVMPLICPLIGSKRLIDINIFEKAYFDAAMAWAKNVLEDENE